MTDEQISRLFKRNTPEPTDGSWADDARRRHGRRQAATVGTAAVAAVAIIGGPLALNLAGSGQPQYATPMTTPSMTDVDPLAPPATDSPSEAPPPGEVPPEAPPAGGHQEPEVCAAARLSPGDDLPEGATRLWLCGEDPSMGGRPGPSEPLTVGVDEAIAAFQALPPRDPNQMCTMEYVLGYTVVGEYPDGSTESVAGELHGCRTVGDRSGGGDFWNTLVGLWAAQRADAPAPELTMDVDTACSMADSILAVSTDDAVAGYLCEGMQDSMNPGSVEGVELPADLVAALRDDIASRAVEGTVFGFSIPGPNLVFVNAYGEPARVFRYASGLYQWGGKVWQPSPELVTQIAEAAASLPEQQTSPEPPYLDGREACQDPASIAAPAAPESAEWVAICPTDPTVAEPVDAIMDPALVARAVETLGSIPADLPECRGTQAEYPIYILFGSGETTTAVQVRTLCGAGDEVVIDGSEDMLKPILDLALEQRAQDQMQSYRGGSVCPVSNSVFPIDLPTDPQSGTVCRYGDPTDHWVKGTGGIEITIPQELARRVASEAAASGTESDVEAPAGDTLVLVDQSAEPVTLTRDADGSFTWSGATASYRWQPSAELAAELDRYFQL